MTDKSIPGAIVGVWGPDGDYVRPFGVADKTTQAPMQTDSYMRIGSLTKTFTITALLQLVDQGKLRLDDPIAKYVAGVPSGDVITLRLLAQMQSGLVTYDGVPEFEAAFTADPQRTFTPTQLLSYALDKPLQFPPGTKYDYCNTNTVLLGLVVEKLSGQSLADYVSEHILVPLKLTHTSTPTTSAFPDPHPQGYTVIDGTERVTTDWNPSWAWSNGNMISTLDDMRIWARTLSSGELLSEEMRYERFSSALPMSETAHSMVLAPLTRTAGSVTAASRLASRPSWWVFRRSRPRSRSSPTPTYRTTPARPSPGLSPRSSPPGTLPLTGRATNARRREGHQDRVDDRRTTIGCRCCIWSSVRSPPNISWWELETAFAAVGGPPKVLRMDNSPQLGAGIGRNLRDRQVSVGGASSRSPERIYSAVAGPCAHSACPIPRQPDSADRSDPTAPYASEKDRAAEDPEWASSGV